MDSLLEIALRKLRGSAEQTFPDTEKRQHSVGTVGVTKMKYIPYEGSHELRVEADVSSGSNRYQCHMVFQDVYYESTDSNQTVSFQGEDEREYHIHPVDPNVTDVKVRCNCLDFYYRFAQANYQSDVLDGNPPPTYVKKTDRPPVNPTNAPGMCKHLMKMMDQLETVGLLRR